MAEKVAEVLMAACDKHGPIAPRYAGELAGPLVLKALQGEAERAERDERAECIQIARAHQHVIEAFDPPDQIRLATYSNGTCELIARAIRARESQPVAPATENTEVQKC